MARVVQMIETDNRRGTGVDHDPYRTVRQWWTLDGKLVVELDFWPHTPDGKAALAKRAAEVAEQETS